MFDAWNWFDWTLAGVTVASVIAAVVKGFVRELISLACVVAAVIIAAVGYQRVARGFEDVSRSHEVALGAAFLALFVGTLAVGALLSWLARRLIKAAGVQWFDRFLGGVFGLARGVVIDCVLLFAVVTFGIKTEVVQGSALAPYVTTGARVISFVMPARLKGQFQAGFEKFRRALAQTDRAALRN